MKKLVCSITSVLLVLTMGATAFASSDAAELEKQPINSTSTDSVITNYLSLEEIQALPEAPLGYQVLERSTEKIDDDMYIVKTLAEDIRTRIVGTQSGTVTYTYYSGGSKVAVYSLNATFSYNESKKTVNIDSHSFTRNIISTGNRTWFKSGNEKTSSGGNSLTGYWKKVTAKAGYTFLGKSYSKSMYIKCTQSGSLSSTDDGYDDIS